MYQCYSDVYRTFTGGGSVFVCAELEYLFKPQSSAAVFLVEEWENKVKLAQETGDLLSFVNHEYCTYFEKEY